FLGRDGAMIDMGSLRGAAAQVRAINDDGVATGNSTLPSGADHAFLYQAGQMIDLGTLGGASSVGFAINSADIVAGNAYTAGPGGGNQRAAIWGPDRHADDLGTLGGEFSQALGVTEAGDVLGLAGA